MRPADVLVTEVETRTVLDLVRDARGGDLDAFATLARSRLGDAFRVAAAIGGAQEAAETTRNAFAAAWRELPRLADDADFDGWLRRILVTECRMHARAPRPSAGPLPATAALDGTPAPAATAGSDDPEGLGRLVGGAAHRASPVELARDEALDRLDAAFATLDPDDRAILVLYHLEGWPLDEIAGAVHRSPGEVRVRLHEARTALDAVLAG